MSTTLLNRSTFYHDKNKKGLIIVRSGSMSLLPLKVTSMSGTNLLKAWVRKHRITPVVIADGKPLYLHNNGSIYYMAAGGFLKPYRGPYSFYELLDAEGPHYWSGYLNIYRLGV